MSTFSDIAPYDGNLPAGGQDKATYGANKDNYLSYFYTEGLLTLQTFITEFNSALVTYPIFDLTATDFNNINVVATEISNNNISLIVGAINDNSLTTVATVAGNLGVVAGVIDSGDFTKVVEIIDSGNFDYFKTNYSTFVTNYDDFGSKHTTFVINYNDFDTKYLNFLTLKSEFDINLLNFNIDFGNFNNNLIDFNNKRDDFNIKFSEVTPKLDTFIANYQTIENAIADSEYLNKVDSAKELSLIQDIKCGLSSQICQFNTIQQQLLFL